jgi:DNA ligase-1
MPYFSTSTLYRTNDKGQTVQWRAFATEDDDGCAFLCTESGQVNGKMKRSKREISKAGRQDTVYEKAKYDAKKKWQDKQDKEGYVEDLANAAQAQTQDEDGATEVPVLPMLANKAVIQREKGMVKGITWPCLVQPKIDGFRCVSRITGGSALLSRKNIPFIGFGSLRDILDNLGLPDSGFGSGRFHLDGELFVDEVGFNALSSVVKRGQHHKDHDPQEVQYRVFDCFDLDHMDTPFGARQQFLKDLLGDGRVHALETMEAASLAQADALMQQFLGEGHEGLMFRCPKSPYVLRKRSPHLLKYKEFHDDEFEIVGFKEGQGDDEGTVVWECVTKDGAKTFSVRPMGTREHRAHLFEHGNDYIGRKLTVKYQELSEDNVPRFPVGKTIRESFDH